MRTEFLRLKKRDLAEVAAPWAAVICKVEGGYMAFESIADWRTWKNQK